jgi:uncharacterized protein (TIGR02118 family)
MIKTFNFFKRRPELSVERFREYWLNQHAAVIRAIPEVRKYVASIALSSSYRKDHEPLYDGISEAWFDDEETIVRIAGSAKLRAAITDDAVFVDTSKAGSIVTHEAVQKDGTPPTNAVKTLSLLTRKAGMDVAAFQSYWRVHPGGFTTDRSQRNFRVHSATCNAMCWHPVTPTAARRATTASQKYGSTISTPSALPAIRRSISRFAPTNPIF